MANGTPNYGQLFSDALNSYNANGQDQNLKNLGYTFVNQDGDQFWQDPQGNRVQGGEGTATTDQQLQGAGAFNAQNWFNQQGIIPLGSQYAKLSDPNNPDAAGGTGAYSQQDNDATARAYGFSNYDALLNHQTGPGQYVNDPILGQIWVPQNTNSQTWNRDYVANANASQGNFINKIADNGGLVYGLAGGIGALAAGGAIAGAAGAGDAVGGAAAGDIANGFDALTMGDASLGNFTGGSIAASDGLGEIASESPGWLNDLSPTPPAGGGGSTTTAPAGTDANGNLVDANGTPYGPPSSSTAGGTVADSTTIPGSNTLTATQGSALSRILNGTATTQDYLSLAGVAGTTLAGILGADASRSANNSAADKMLNLGAPARAAFNATLDPNYNPSSMPGYQSAIDSVMNSYLRKASTGGNPFSNPGVSMEANRYVTDSTALPALNNYRNTLVNAGNTGVSNANTPNINAANSANQTTNAVTGGLGALTAQAPTDYSQVLKQILNLGQAVV